jgi:protein phosphatase-4 regulatory subunit 3
LFAAALKFFRNLIGLQDEFYNQQMMQEGLFEPVLDIVIETMPRDNLLNSACLEFFDFIRRENIKTLISHLVENYREKLLQITYVDTFGNFVLRYDATQGFAPTLDTAFLDTEEDTPKRSETGRGGRWDNGIKGLDSAEEEYFNTSDDEDENVNKSPSSRASMNGASHLSKPLVDYNSDEDTENMDTDVSVTVLPSKAGTSESPKSSSAGVLTPKSSPSPAPLEKLSEKRRREEDEEDELGKLSHHKRRNSSSSAASNTSSMLRRKRGFSNGVNGSPGNSGKPSKIAISLSPAVKTGGEGKGGEGDS